MSHSTCRSPIWLIDGFFRQVPRDLAEAAQIDGCTRWQAFWQVEFPLAGPGIASAAIFAFLTSWNEFALASQLTRSVNSKTLAGRAARLYRRVHHRLARHVRAGGRDDHPGADAHLHRAEAPRVRPHLRRSEGLTMATVSLSKLVKRYGTTEIVHGIDLEVTDREFIALVGPSGCGKSTTLRMIAGLEEISGGEVRIGGQVVNDLPPRSRNISMVFQSYALYPHMTVRENMGFSLKIAGRPRGGNRPSRRGGGGDPGPRTPLGAATLAALRRTAAAGRDGPRHRARSGRLPVRRAARPTSTPSCAPRCAPKSRSCTPRYAPRSST